MPNADDKDPDMQADCRITPGAYGGPLCDQYGVVVGMIHKRSKIEQGVDPFAFVVPCDLLQTFLKKNLPAGATLPRVKTGSQTRGWDVVKEQLEPSVVRVQCFE